MIRGEEDDSKRGYFDGETDDLTLPFLAARPWTQVLMRPVRGKTRSTGHGHSFSEG